MCLVEGTDRKDLVCAAAAVDVGIGLKDLKAVLLGARKGVLMQEAAVGLEIDYAVGRQEVAVSVQEHRAGEPSALTAQLWVCKGDPDLVNLILCKKRFNELNPGADECHVGHVEFGCLFGTFPQAGTFDVNSNEVAVWDHFCQGNGVLTFSAAKLKGDRVVVPEHLLVPFPF